MSNEENDGKESDDGEQHPLAQVSRIDPKEIPDVPSNNFLMRGASKKGEDGEGRKEREKDRSDKEKPR